jgi:hypothetical protein
MQNTHEWKITHPWQELSKEDVLLNEKITEKLSGTNTLVAILEHHGKITVPRKNLMELAEVEQIWPNDFIYNHGASMAITYNKETDEMGFELKYSSDNDHPADLVAYACTRNAANVGFVDHDSPVYKD